MKIVTILLTNRNGNKMNGILIVDGGGSGFNKEFEYTPQELLNIIDEYHIKGNEIVTNEPIVLELLQFPKNEKHKYTRFRNSKVESILDWWKE